LAALEGVRAWTRARFELSEDATILVSEVTCALPGCPPLHTVVVFWSDNGKRHQLKLFKPVVEVIPDDLPPTWMKRALVAIDGIGDECC
jgi:nitrate reductase delta subunit